MAMSEAVGSVLNAINDQSKDVEALRVSLESATKASSGVSNWVNKMQEDGVQPEQRARRQRVFQIDTDAATNRWNDVLHKCQVYFDRASSRQQAHAAVSRLDVRPL